MIRIIRRLSLMAACIMAAASCQKDDTLYYNNLTMGNIVDGRFVSDQGNIFNVVEVACGTAGHDEKSYGPLRHS